MNEAGVPRKTAYTESVLTDKGTKVMSWVWEYEYQLNGQTYLRKVYLAAAPDTLDSRTERVIKVVDSKANAVGIPVAARKT